GVPYSQFCSPMLELGSRRSGHSGQPLSFWGLSNLTDTGPGGRRGIICSFPHGKAGPGRVPPPTVQPRDRDHKWGEALMNVVPSVFAVPLGPRVEAVPLPPPPADDMLTRVRGACGAGMPRVNGVGMRTPARRAASRCARGVTC